MEGEAFLEECIALKEGKAKMKESYMNLLSDIDQPLMVAEMYQCALEKEVEVSESLHRKWEATCDSWNITHEALQESRFLIDQLQKELNVPHPSSCMRDDHVHMKGVTFDVMEESHVEGGNEKRADL